MPHLRFLAKTLLLDGTVLASTESAVMAVAQEKSYSCGSDRSDSSSSASSSCILVPRFSLSLVLLFASSAGWLVAALSR